MSKRSTVRVASRSSRLALAQAGSVCRLLSEEWPDQRFEIVKVDTRGDREIDRPLPEIGGKGLFTEALEAALLAGEVDLAVHSLKDLPTDAGEGLKLGAVPRREDPRDVWVIPPGGPATLRQAPTGARVGTGSERRRAQLLSLRPDLDVRPIRGNVETRLAKLDRGEFDALVLAAAGLIRLDFHERLTAFLDPPGWLPAPGQGAIAVQCRAEDPAVADLLAALEDRTARVEVDAERGLLARLQGGCQIPVGARAELAHDRLALQGLIARPDGSQVIRADMWGTADAPDDLGRRVAEELLSHGGEEILADYRDTPAESAR